MKKGDILYKVVDTEEGFEIVAGDFLKQTYLNYVIIIDNVEVRVNKKKFDWFETKEQAIKGAMIKYREEKEKCKKRALKCKEICIGLREVLEGK